MELFSSQYRLQVFTVKALKKTQGGKQNKQTKTEKKKEKSLRGKKPNQTKQTSKQKNPMDIF